MLLERYEGFLFEHSRRDINSSGAVRRERYISIQKSYEAACAAVMGIIGPGVSFHLIDRGEKLLSEALDRGIAPGETRRYDS